MTQYPPKEKLVAGLHVLEELLMHAPDKIRAVFLDNGEKGGRKAQLIDQLMRKKIPIRRLSKQELTKLIGTDSHQGCVVEIRERIFLDTSSFLKKISSKTQSIVLMVDQVFDPQNFGSLLRAAECLGADGVIWSKNRGSELTAVAAKASCGASELIPLVRVSNLAETVSQFQKNGFEVVVSLLDPKSEPIFGFSFCPKTLLVVGSEGEGVQPLIQKRSDRSVYIPMKGKIGSLNVAQATAILLSEFSRKNVC